MQNPVVPRLHVPALICHPGLPLKEPARRKGTPPSVPTMPQSPLPGTPPWWHHPRPTTHLQSSVLSRQVGVVIPAGRDALEEDELGRAVVGAGKQDSPLLGGVGLGGAPARGQGHPPGSAPAAAPAPGTSRRERAGGTPVQCLARRLCLRCRLLISQQASRKPCPPSLPPLADNTRAFSLSSAAPGLVGRSGERALPWGAKSFWCLATPGGTRLGKQGGKDTERNQGESGKKRKEEEGWGGWEAAPSLQGPETLLGTRTTALGRTSLPHAGVTQRCPSAASPPPAAGHGGERGDLEGSQGPSPAASCQCDPPPA